MTRVQQVLFELEADYFGNPYCVSGNAIFNAIAQRVDRSVRRSLCVSHGVFTPGEYGEYPEWHSQDGYAGVLGSSLPAVEAYEDLFLYRDAAQRWLLDSRARELHNAHAVQSHGGRVTFAPECHVGRPPEVRNHKRSVQWYVQCYLHAGRDDGEVLPVGDEVLDALRVGGGRNYGLGEVSVADSQLVDLDALEYSRLTDSDEGYVVELVSPFVLASEYPGADSQSVPWWWEPPSHAGVAAEGDGLRRRMERLVAGGEVHEVATVDHGQVVGYAGSDPVATAKSGVLRVGTHSRYGFGELRMRPAGADRVPGRTCSATSVSGGES